MKRILLITALLVGTAVQCGLPNWLVQFKSNGPAANLMSTARNQNNIVGGTRNWGNQFYLAPNADMSAELTPIPWESANEMLYVSVIGGGEYYVQEYSSPSGKRSIFVKRKNPESLDYSVIQTISDVGENGEYKLVVDYDRIPKVSAK